MEMLALAIILAFVMYLAATLGVLKGLRKYIGIATREADVYDLEHRDRCAVRYMGLGANYDKEIVAQKIKDNRELDFD
jgi:hypothetical protein